MWSRMGSLPVLGSSLGNIMPFFMLLFCLFVFFFFALAWDSPCVHAPPHAAWTWLWDEWFYKNHRDTAEQPGKRAKPYRYRIKSRKPLWWSNVRRKARLEAHSSPHGRPGAIRVPHLFNCWHRCSLSARSLLLVSSTASRVSFSLLFSSWSFWLLYCRSATQVIKSEVSLSQ